MRCSNCGRENVEGSRFCNQCATPFVRRCPECTFENDAGAKFCSQCAASLDVHDARPAPGQLRETAITGERRHLTVLMCDLVGSTALAARLDPEEWRETVAGYQRAAADAITHFGGHLARYLGDGVLAFFGYPEAHDNDAERAVRAGLALLDSLDRINQQPGRVELSARIGIDSGAVVVGGGTGQDADVFGDAPNIAARVEALAAPGTVAISAATQRLIAGLFVVEDLGAQTLKGIERPIQLYRVVRASGIRGRFEAAASAGRLTPFVGREDELRSLMSRWRRALDGEGQVVTIMGEAGIGKSRLVRQFHQAITGTPHTWLEAATGVFYHNTPFYPVSEMLRQLLGEGAAEEQLAQLATRLTAVGLKPAAAISLLAPLLNLAPSAHYPASTLPPEQQRRRLLATLVEWLLGAARAQPLISVIEDLHWIDPSTLELIQLLVEQGATGPLLLLFTARPEFRPPWLPRSHHTQLTLNRLSAREARTMVGEVAAGNALSDETVATVLERTGGVPLFVEELTKSVLESGEVKYRAIPVTLHDSLMARLDRLGPAKEVAQVGAVIGRDFSYELLQAVHQVPELELQETLRKLADAELVFVRGIAPEASYQFKHALIRDAAYEAILKRRRKELHGVVARTIDEQFPALKESHPEVLAQHWSEAGEIAKAIQYFELAARRSTARSAMMEAERHYRSALELLTRLPANVERDRHEVELHLASGPALIAVKGWAAPEVEFAYTRARELCQPLGDAPFAAMFGSWTVPLARGELTKAYLLAEQLLRQAQAKEEPAQQLYAQFAVGQTSYWMGKFVSAREYLEIANSLYDSERDRPLAFLYGFDAGVCCLSYLSWILWQLGYPDQALDRGNESIALAQRLSHPRSLGWAEFFACVLFQYRGEACAAQEKAETVIALSAEHALTDFSAWATSLRGWAMAEQGRYEDGILWILRGLNLSRATGAGLLRPYILTLLAGAYKETGRLGEGLSSLEEAINAADQFENRIFEAESNRVKGELLLKQDNSNPDAQHYLERAIEIARSQSARSLELRATMSLAQLLTNHGRGAEARLMLGEVFRSFTEGFGTAGLQDAKALLGELSD